MAILLSLYLIMVLKMCNFMLCLQCLGDQQAALVGQSCFEKGQAKNTLVSNTQSFLV